MPGNPFAEERREAERRVAEAEAARAAKAAAAAKVGNLQKIIADKGYQGAEINYGTRTVGGRGADREVTDSTKVEGFTVPNPDGTYSRYDSDGNFSHTFSPSSGGFLGGISNLLSDPTLHQIAAIAATATGHPEIAALISGASRAGQDGNIEAGLTQGLKSYALAKGAEHLAGAGTDVSGPGPANPMQLDPAQMGANAADAAASVTSGVDAAMDAANGYDYNTAPMSTGETIPQDVLKSITPGAPTDLHKTFNDTLRIAKNPGNAAVNTLAQKLGIPKDVLDTLGLVGVTGTLTKGVNDVVKGATGGGGNTPGGTKPSGTPADGTTPYNIPPALLALLMQQQPQQAPTQTPLVDLKSASKFDPFGEFNPRDEDTAEAASGGSISDLIRMLRS